MPTPSEQRALAFVAIVVLLGGVVRVVRAGSAPQPTALEQQALARQATAAESAASASRPKKGSKTARVARVRRNTVPVVVGGVSSVPFSDVRPGFPSQGVNGYPPPSPRIDTDVRDNRQTQNYRLSPTSRSSATSQNPSPSSPHPPIDLDRASEQEIDALPRVGPTMAHRIVANRDSFGAFGSLEGLRRVRGMGPATLDRLATLVTFSGRPSSRP
jgi:competence protein ComEA